MEALELTDGSVLTGRIHDKQEELDPPQSSRYCRYKKNLTPFWKISKLLKFTASFVFFQAIGALVTLHPHNTTPMKKTCHFSLSFAASYVEFLPHYYSQTWNKLFLPPPHRRCHTVKNGCTFRFSDGREISQRCRKYTKV